MRGSRPRSWLGRFFRFALVGLSGLALHQAVLWAVTEFLGVHYLLSAVVATQASTLWNFGLTEAWVFRADRPGRLLRLFWFALLNYAWLACRAPILFGLTDLVGIHYFLSNLIVLGSATLARFAVSDRWIWAEGSERGAWRYDLHGLLRLESSAPLPDLEWFLVERLDGPPDLVVEVGGARFGGPRLRPLVRRGGDAVTFVEHLGGLGFAARIELGPSARVQVSRLLGSSPYVLYANVVEPVLRWLLARKGRALVHAACLEISGRGVLLTARTDTGKTTSCLRSVREHGAGFLGDDMLIVDAQGTGYCYPKPLTVSAHTIGAVRGSPLPLRRRIWLQVQGRLHSRGGRRVGLTLARLNLPVATMNAVLQMIVNPPKFHIRELVPGARVVPSAVITHMAVIERGSTLVEPLTPADADRALEECTEDAYGFPPYPLIAEALSDGFRAAEADVRRTMLLGARSVRIRAADRHWYEQLRLIAEGALIPTAGPLRWPILGDGEEEAFPASGDGERAPLVEGDGDRSPSGDGDRRLPAGDGDRRLPAGDGDRRLPPEPGSVAPSSGRERGTRLRSAAVASLVEAPPRTPPRRVVTIPDVPRPAPPRRERSPLASRLGLLAAGAAILAAGAFLRLWDINALGFNSDEAVYAGQGAAIAGDPALQEIFPVFRAHPLLFQFILAVIFRLGVTDLAPRLAGVGFGLGTVVLVYFLGKVLYGRAAGLAAALFLALMPYHVVVSRQALLDGPMTFFATLSLLLLALFASTERPAWLYATGAALGLAFLAKEPSVLLIPATYAFLALEPGIRVRVRDVALSLAVFALVVAPFPASLVLAGGTGTARNFLVWQLFRRPNHDWWFYAATVPPALGVLLVGIAVAAVWLLRRARTWRETLLLSWILVPVALFQTWPVKGFQYLLPIAPAVALLAARFVTRFEPRPGLLGRGPRAGAVWRLGLAGVVSLSLAVPAWEAVNRAPTEGFLAGSGGVPGGRETGRWVAEHVPEGGQLMTIGPSMANIIQFYGHRRAFGLSVSPNPLHRNPAYDPIVNPDFEIRDNNLQYVVWDAYSAARSPFFSNKLLRYADRYNGRVVHTESLRVRTPDGVKTDRPVIVVYEVRP